MKMSLLEKIAAGAIMAGVCAGVGIYIYGLFQTDPNGPWYDPLKNPYVQLGLATFCTSVVSAATWGIGRDIRNGWIFHNAEITVSPLKLTNKISHAK